MAELRPQAAWAENWAKFGRVVFEIGFARGQTDTQNTR